MNLIFPMRGFVSARTTVTAIMGSVKIAISPVALRRHDKPAMDSAEHRAIPSIRDLRSAPADLDQYALMSALCQKRTDALQQISTLFDHLVGAREQGRRDFEFGRYVAF
jgi:hypothetical protein